MKMLKNGKSMDIQNIVDRLSVPLIGVIIDDDEVIATSNQGKSVVTSQAQNPAAIGYANLARRILGENLPLNEIDDNSTVDKKPGFWYRMFHR
ncbi:MAG: septum site-determining protein MinD, partial [Bombilactobacillus sp.]